MKNHQQPTKSINENILGKLDECLSIYEKIKMALSSSKFKEDYLLELITEFLKKFENLLEISDNIP